MGRIVVSKLVTLDGVVQDPDGAEGFERGGWLDQFLGEDRDEWAQVVAEEAPRAEALLLGRRSDAYFGSRWNSRSGEWADRLNGLPKYVVSSTLEQPVWTNVTVLRGDVAEEVSTLKRELDGEILVYGSRRLVHALIEHDLVDELRLFVFPVVLGAGERLFGETSAEKPLRFTGARTIGDGLVRLSYELVRDA